MLVPACLPDAGTPIVRPFDCLDPIWSGDDLAEAAGSGPRAPGLMALTLDNNPLPWADDSRTAGDLHFQKVGLALKTGAVMTISVPAVLRGYAKFGWSNTGAPAAETLQVSGCESDPPGDEWVVYPGGFWR